MIFTVSPSECSEARFHEQRGTAIFNLRLIFAEISGVTCIQNTRSPRASPPTHPLSPVPSPPTSLCLLRYRCTSYTETTLSIIVAVRIARRRQSSCCSLIMCQTQPNNTWCSSISGTSRKSEPLAPQLTVVGRSLFSKPCRGSYDLVTLGMLVTTRFLLILIVCILAGFRN